MKTLIKEVTMNQQFNYSKSLQRDILLTYVNQYLDLPKFQRKDILKGIKGTLLKRNIVTEKQFLFLLSWLRNERPYKKLTDNNMKEIFKDVINGKFTHILDKDINNKGISTLESFLKDSDDFIPPLYIQSEVQIV